MEVKPTLVATELRGEKRRACGLASWLMVFWLVMPSLFGVEPPLNAGAVAVEFQGRRGGLRDAFGCCDAQLPGARPTSRAFSWPQAPVVTLIHSGDCVGSETHRWQDPLLRLLVISPASPTDAAPSGKTAEPGTTGRRGAAGHHKHVLELCREDVMLVKRIFPQPRHQ